MSFRKETTCGNFNTRRCTPKCRVASTAKCVVLGTQPGKRPALEFRSGQCSPETTASSVLPSSGVFPLFQFAPAVYSVTAVVLWGAADFTGGYGARRANAFVFTAFSHVCAFA